MPSIYSSLYQNFIRQGATKSLSHGYAQSLVAASHPHLLNSQNRPFTSRTNNRFNRLHTHQLQNAFHTERAPSLPQGSLPDLALGHVGLETYFESLAKKGEEDGVTVEQQKLLEAASTVATTEEGARASTTLAPNAASTGADDTLAELNARLEQELEKRKLYDAIEEEVLSSRSRSEIESIDITRPGSPGSIANGTVKSDTAAPLVDSASKVYADHLQKLAQAGHYEEIAGVFETMLVNRVHPVPSAYNALLMAAIHIPTNKSEVVTKSLQVYTDMVARKVAPDSDTYDILVGVLAARSLEVATLKSSLEETRERYGGMEKAGNFMLASSELDYAILCEDDRLDLALSMFDQSVKAESALYSAETYYQLIAACVAHDKYAQIGRLLRHMKESEVTPFSAVFPDAISGLAKSGDLVGAVDLYNEYKSRAIAHNNGQPSLQGRLDAEVYAAVVYGYVACGKVGGALDFYKKVMEKYGSESAQFSEIIVDSGLVKGFADQRFFGEALQWAQSLEGPAMPNIMGRLSVRAADKGDWRTATSAFSVIPSGHSAVVPAACALLAFSVRMGDIASATMYWKTLTGPNAQISSSLIQPTCMYTVALLGSGRLSEGLDEAQSMFDKIKAASSPETLNELNEQLEEAIDFIANFMNSRKLQL